MAAVTLIVSSIFVVLVPVASILTIAIQRGLGLLTVIQDGELSLDIIENGIETVGCVIASSEYSAASSCSGRWDCSLGLSC